MPLAAHIRHAHALLRLVPDVELLRLRIAIEAEMARRDICEHGIAAGEWCEPCSREYRRARREHFGDEGGG